MARGIRSRFPERYNDANASECASVHNYWFHAAAFLTNVAYDWKQVRNADTLHVLVPSQVQVSLHQERQVKQKQRLRAEEQQARTERERDQEHKVQEQQQENDNRSRQESARADMLHRLTAARKVLEDAFKSRGSTPHKITPRLPEADQGSTRMSNSALLHGLPSAEHAAREMDRAARKEELLVFAAAGLLGLFVGDALGAAGDGMMNEQLMRDANGVSSEIRPQHVRRTTGSVDCGGVAALQEVAGLGFPALLRCSGQPALPVAGARQL